MYLVFEHTRVPQHATHLASHNRGGASYVPYGPGWQRPPPCPGSPTQARAAAAGAAAGGGAASCSAVASGEAWRRPCPMAAAAPRPRLPGAPVVVVVVGGREGEASVGQSIYIYPKPFSDQRVLPSLFPPTLSIDASIKVKRWVDWPTRAKQIATKSHSRTTGPFRPPPTWRMAGFE